MHRVKRKVAIILGYLGTGYHGLQINENSKGSVKTIEADLWDALIKADTIKPSNQESLTKIKWSRSSRTDKGVHAVRVVISAKLELKAEWSDQQSFPQLVEELNELLPPAIRVFSVTRVSKSFQARGSALWRQYRYILPLSLLFEEEDSMERRNEILATFKEVCSQLPNAPFSPPFYHASCVHS